VKLFLEGVKQTAGLSKPGLAMFELVYRRDIKELLDRGFLFKSLMEGGFFVNIRYMFNGDRQAFVKGYKRRNGTPEQAKIPAIPKSTDQYQTP